MERVNGVLVNWKEIWRKERAVSMPEIRRQCNRVGNKFIVSRGREALIIMKDGNRAGNGEPIFGFKLTNKALNAAIEEAKKVGASHIDMYEGFDAGERMSDFHDGCYEPWAGEVILDKIWVNPDCQLPT